MPTPHEFNRSEELKAFYESKSGVKGLIDSGITKVPQIFVRSPEDLASDQPYDPTGVEIPLIDLGAGAEDVVVRIGKASENFGIFQVINHGIEQPVLEEMLMTTRSFHELPKEMKMEFQANANYDGRVHYWSNHDLFRTTFATWRDTLSLARAPGSDPINPLEIPSVCRNATMEYTKRMERLATHLFELLSKALGLEANHLSNMGCADGYLMVCHYYPPCPEPHLTLGTRDHTDAGFITILIPGQTGGGLQILHQDKWIDVPIVPGALIVNIGDLLQLMSNDKFKSVNHRVVVAKEDGPRVSVGTFFRIKNLPEVYGPIKELLSAENPPIYKEVIGNDYVAHYNSNEHEGTSALQRFKL